MASLTKHKDFSSLKRSSSARLKSASKNAKKIGLEVEEFFQLLIRTKEKRKQCKI
jgi:hypothetical protein